MIDIEELESAAKAGKRAETDYGQSFIRRIADEAMFERAATPEAILELIHRVKVLERALAISADDDMRWPRERCINQAERELAVTDREEK